jgi:4a-hydroxytetrahydrobiopterin dehydratase
MTAQSTHNSELAAQHCKPHPAGTPPLSADKISLLLQQLYGWTLHDKVISKTVVFTNFHQAMSFVNAVAWVSNLEDHHPDLGISYNKCVVEYSIPPEDSLKTILSAPPRSMPCYPFE